MKTLAAIVCLSVLSLAALPEIRVNTMNNAAINSTSANWKGAGNCVTTNTFIHKYTPMSLTLTDPSNSRNNISVAGFADSIRMRGNSTAVSSISKKPYRIKFGEHQSMFGTKKHKSWALLANWYDPTFALNAVAFELGKRMGLPGTPNSFFVDLYLNGNYRGIYQVTDIVQVNKGRVEVDTLAGWLAEFDYHCPSDKDEVDFLTTYPTSKPSTTEYKWTVQLHTFIKSPETNYQFVKDQINQLTTTMFNKSGFPENGYRDLVDLDSYAKYIMVELFMDNFDFICKADTNGLASNFAHKDKDKKIVAGPLWDLDLTAGVDNKINFPKHFQYFNYPIKPRHPYYKRFFDDPVFLAKWKKNWDKYKPDFQDMTRVMDSIATYVEGSVEKNFALQKGGGSYYTPEAPATKQAYKDGVGKLKTWWNSRIDFFQQEMTKMNIDISKDIVEPSSSSIAKSSSSSIAKSSSSSSNKSSSSGNRSSSSGNSSSSSGNESSSSIENISSSSEETDITPILTGFLENLPRNTKIEVYNLQGKRVSIPVQTKGIYIIRTTHGSEKKIQRMVVK